MSLDEISLKDDISFSEAGYTEDHKIGKKYGLLICDTDRQYTNLNSFTSLNLQMIYDLGLDSDP